MGKATVTEPVKKLAVVIRGDSDSIAFYRAKEYKVLVLGEERQPPRGLLREDYFTLASPNFLIDLTRRVKELSNSETKRVEVIGGKWRIQRGTQEGTDKFCVETTKKKEICSLATEILFTDAPAGQVTVITAVPDGSSILRDAFISKDPKRNKLFMSAGDRAGNQCPNFSQLLAKTRIPGETNPGEILWRERYPVAISYCNNIEVNGNGSSTNLDFIEKWPDASQKEAGPRDLPDALRKQLLRSKNIGPKDPYRRTLLNACMAFTIKLRGNWQALATEAGEWIKILEGNYAEDVISFAADMFFGIGMMFLKAHKDIDLPLPKISLAQSPTAALYVARTYVSLAPHFHTAPNGKSRLEPFFEELRKVVESEDPHTFEHALHAYKVLFENPQKTRQEERELESIALAEMLLHDAKPHVQSHLLRLLPIVGPYLHKKSTTIEEEMRQVETVLKLVEQKEKSLKGILAHRGRPEKAPTDLFEQEIKPLIMEMAQSLPFPEGISSEASAAIRVTAPVALLEQKEAQLKVLQSEERRLEEESRASIALRNLELTRLKEAAELLEKMAGQPLPPPIEVEKRFLTERIARFESETADLTGLQEEEMGRVKDAVRRKEEEINLLVVLGLPRENDIAEVKLKLQSAHSRLSDKRQKITDLLINVSDRALDLAEGDQTFIIVGLEAYGTIWKDLPTEVVKRQAPRVRTFFLSTDKTRQTLSLKIYQEMWPTITDEARSACLEVAQLATTGQTTEARQAARRWLSAINKGTRGLQCR